MPFQSKAQARFLYSQHPDIAARWEKHTPKKTRRNLPQHVGKSQLRSRSLTTGAVYKPVTQLSARERKSHKATMLRRRNDPGYREYEEFWQQQNKLTVRAISITEQIQRVRTTQNAGLFNPAL